jgi:hypothetical protein
VSPGRRQRADILPVEEAVAGLGLSELRELRSLRHENAKLKEVVADLTLDRHILQRDRPKRAVKPRARCTLAEWAQTTYRLPQRQVRPHSALQDRAPAEMGALWTVSREPCETTTLRKDRVETEIAGRFVTISPW